MKAFDLDDYPALHSAVVGVYGSPSGAPRPQFLMSNQGLTGLCLFFIECFAFLSRILKKKIFVVVGNERGVCYDGPEIIMLLCRWFLGIAAPTFDYAHNLHHHALQLYSTYLMCLFLSSVWFKSGFPTL